MKKGLLFIFILLTIFVIGCKQEDINEDNNNQDDNNIVEVDKSFEVNGYEFIDGEYIKYISSDDALADLSAGIEINDTATIAYFSDEQCTEELECPDVEVVEGDNYFYAKITFSDSSTTVLTLNAYRLRVFTVEFITNCQQELRKITVEENSIVPLPDVELIKKGYTFKGWNYRSKPVTSDLTIEAKWAANSYIVTYNPNGAEMNDTELYVTYGDPYSLEIPTLEGYDFLGWYYNDELVNSETWDIDADAVLEAKWEKETVTYEIEYVIVGAVGPNLQRTYTNKERVVLRTPYKCGYQFIGWYYEGDFSGERVYEIPEGTEGNLRLYSKWKAFNLEGKKISFLGDSITTFYSESSDIYSAYKNTKPCYYPQYSSTVLEATDTWWYQVVLNTKTSLLINDSISATTVYESTDSGTSYSRINNLAGSDIVIIYMGTNDLAYAYSVSKFEEYYNLMLDRVKEVCKDAFVFCCTMGYSPYSEYYINNRESFNNIISKCATDHDYTVIPFEEVQTIDNHKSILGDGLHPNKTGMKLLSDLAVEYIKNYVNA